MRFKPIPKRLLIHTATLTRKNDDSGFGGVGGESNEIEFVRFEPSASKQKTTVNDEKLIRGTLFIDRENSTPFLVPNPDDEMTISNDPRISGILKVAVCDIIYSDDRGSIHHLEVTLI